MSLQIDNNIAIDLDNEVGELRAENERLRAALKEIAEYPGYSVIELTSKARRALQSE